LSIAKPRAPHLAKIVSGCLCTRMKADIAKWGAVIEKAGIPKRE
jgi:hypothetical protein